MSERMRVTRPEWSDAELASAVARLFPVEHRDEVLALLRSYGELPYEREPARVRRVIVQTSGGSLEHLRTLVAVAKRDYRNVLIGDRGPDAPPGP